MQSLKLKTRSASESTSFRNKKYLPFDDSHKKTRISISFTPKQSGGIVKSPATSSFSTSNKLDLTYNKWFIHPSLRMKQSCSFQRINKKQETFLYRQLYQERYPDPDCPFKEKVSEKMKLLELLPRTNIRCLQGFQKTQLKKHKRVPQIVQMLLEKVSKNKN